MFLKSVCLRPGRSDGAQLPTPSRARVGGITAKLRNQALTTLRLAEPFRSGRSDARPRMKRPSSPRRSRIPGLSNASLPQPSRRKELWFSCSRTAESDRNDVATASSVKATATITFSPFRSQSAVADGGHLTLQLLLLGDHA